VSNPFFNQLSVYRLNNYNGDFPDLNTLNDRLKSACIKPCMGLDWDSIGFASPVSFSPEMVFPAQNIWRIALKKEEKVLPAAVVRDILEEKINEIREAEGRNVGRKEKMGLKETITDDLLPRAFIKSSLTEALIDTQHGLLLINQVNINRAEMLLTKLRDALGGLEAKLPRTQQSPGSLMTEWLLNGAAEGYFDLEDFCELKGFGDGAPITRVIRQDLTSDVVVQQVKSGMVVTQLGLRWKDKVRFILTQDFTLKQIQFLDVIQEEVASYGEGVEQETFASQILMAETFKELIEELSLSLGGWLPEFIN
jgi:recombination associated protein RdgC